MARRYLRVSAGLADLKILAYLIPASGYLHGAKPTSIDAGICGFVANIYFCDIDMPLKKFVVAHDNIVRLPCEPCCRQQTGLDGYCHCGCLGCG